MSSPSGRQVSFWEGRRVFVTGATGMVGSWLVKELLSLRAQVVVLVRDADPQSELYRSGDISRVSVVSGALEEYATLARALAEHEIETVFHLGALTIVGTAYQLPLAAFEANIRGTYNLLEACRLQRRTIQGIVLASSDKAYGDQESLPYTESMPLEGIHPYDVSKSCSDLLCRAYHRTYGLPLGVMRCGNTYGGGDLNWSRIIPGTIRSCLLGQAPVIRSDGTFLRDYIFVEDVVNAYVRLAERLKEPAVQGEAFNIGTETPTNVLRIVDIIQKLMGCKHLAPVIQGTAKAEIHNQYLSSKKARDILEWGPQFPLEQGMEKTIRWYESYLDCAGSRQ